MDKNFYFVESQSSTIKERIKQKIRKEKKLKLFLITEAFHSTHASF